MLSRVVAVVISVVLFTFFVPSVYADDPIIPSINDRVEDTIDGLRELPQDVWDQMSDKQKDNYFKTAIDKCGGVMSGVSVEIPDYYKFQYYNGMVHSLLHPDEDVDDSVFLSLELLGVADFSTGHYNEIHGVSNNIDLNNKLHHSYNVLFVMRAANGNYCQLEPGKVYNDNSFSYTLCFYHPDGTKYKTLDGTGGSCDYSKRSQIQVDLTSGKFPEGITKSDSQVRLTGGFHSASSQKYKIFANIYYYLGIDDPSELDDIYDSPLDPGEDVPGDEEDDPDYSDQTIANADIIELLKKIYEEEKANGNKLTNLSGLLSSLIAKTDKLNQEATQQQILAILQSLDIAIDSGGDSDIDIDGDGNIDEAVFDRILDAVNSNNALLSSLNSFMQNNLYSLLLDISRKLNDLNNGNDKDYSDLLAEINASILSLAANSSIGCSSELMDLLNDIKQSIKDYSYPNYNYNSRFSSILDRLDTMCQLLGADITPSFSKTSLTDLSKDELDRIDVIADIVMTFPAIIAYYNYEALITDLQALMFPGVSPSDLTFSYKGTDIVILRSGCLDGCTDILFVLKILITFIVGYWWLVRMRSHFAHLLD